MKKLILCLTLIWALSSTAVALQCQTCADEQCSTTIPVTCSSETMCVTASIQATSYGPTNQQIFKACASSSLCPAADVSAQTFSANLGVLVAVASAKCCNTDNCNIDTLPFPAAQTDNTLRCFTCDPMTSQCTSQVQCRGEEDQCFAANVTIGSSPFPTFGCVSTNLCAAAISLGSLPFMQSNGSISSGPSCCGTSLCNTATTTTTAPTTTTTAPTTTAAPTTTTTTTTSDAFCFRLSMIHLLLGLIIFAVC
ncbi:integumentary mucin C.1-like [Osmerus eperlanus]|uniref:integumentary mucin C.1-like n=1 Tax=Osmerus eperlanus TaxID=29151 RepID=UPI002E0D4BAF